MMPGKGELPSCVRGNCCKLLQSAADYATTALHSLHKGLRWKQRRRSLSSFMQGVLMKWRTLKSHSCLLQGAILLIWVSSLKSTSARQHDAAAAELRYP